MKTHSALGQRMPVLFLGHGSPMNAIVESDWSQAMASLGSRLQQPEVILCISAHWYIRGVRLTANERPKTIHDFSGFPEVLYQVQYPAPGSPEFAKTLAESLGDFSAELSLDWGLDHGTWSVLRWVFPRADIPIVQMSLDRNLSIEQHLRLGSQLKRLRDSGVLIVGSGNIVHNLRVAFQAMSNPEPQPGWATAFDHEVFECLKERATERLLNLVSTPNGARCHPSPEHWLPLIYTYSVTEESDKLENLFEEMGDLAGISMRSLIWSGAAPRS